VVTYTHDGAFASPPFSPHHALLVVFFSHHFTFLQLNHLNFDLAGYPLL